MFQVAGVIVSMLTFMSCDLAQENQILIAVLPFVFLFSACLSVSSNSLFEVKGNQHSSGTKGLFVSQVISLKTTCSHI